MRIFYHLNLLSSNYSRISLYSCDCVSRNLTICTLILTRRSTINHNSKETERNNLVSIRFTRFQVSDKSVKHRNIDPKKARRGNMVVVDVRTSNNIDECLLGPWKRQYLIVAINKRQRLGPNLPDEELTITLYEPWKVVDSLPLGFKED